MNSCIKNIKVGDLVQFGYSAVNKLLSITGLVVAGPLLRLDWYAVSLPVKLEGISDKEFIEQIKSCKNLSGFKIISNLENHRNLKWIANGFKNIDEEITFLKIVKLNKTIS